jgi:hypothetical protein
MNVATLAMVSLAGAQDFEVSFEDCTEFAGIALVPEAQARALVPSSYTLAGDTTSAVVVVRVVECQAVSVDGGPAQPTRLAQIGVTLVGPDATADIDNYLLWYVTDNGQLHGRLQAAGLDSVQDSLDYAVSAGSLAIEVDSPQSAAYTVSGTAIAPASAPTQFVARWWGEGRRGTVQMLTDLPDIQFGSASTLLTTDAGSELALLIGGTELTFVLLDSYNAFASAFMTVTVD